METTNDIQIYVLNNFQLLIPLSGEADAFVFTQTKSPSFGLILTRTDTHESYHYQIQIVQSNEGKEEIISNGLVWAKRTPYQFQKQQNTSTTEALICRARITSGVFDFRRNKVRSIRFVVRCFSNNILLSTGTSQICRVLPKKRIADEDTEDNFNGIIPIYWSLASQQDFANKSTACVRNQNEPVYSSPEEYQDEDSVMATWNDSEEQFASYHSNEGTDDNSLNLDITTSHPSYEMLEPQSVPVNNHSEHYMVLYNGNAEVIGNFRALNFYKASDMRIKEDVRLLIDNEYDPRSVLLKIDGVSYKFKHGTTNAPMNRRFVGYIAQQIESVVPEAVQLINGILHVDYESLIPYLSESIKQNFNDINDMRADMKSDVRQIHKVIDMMYTEFIKRDREERSDTKSTTKNQSRNRSVGWIIGTSLTVLMLISVTVGVFLLMPLVHQAPNNNGPSLTNVPTAPSTVQTPTPLPLFPSMDQEVLVEFYNATGGKNWKNASLPSISVCEWPGVTCDEDFRVVSIVETDDLVGTLPDSIGKLSKLRTLRLIPNKLNGTIPTTIGNLTNLVELTLAYGCLSGSVPTEIFSLTSLRSLSLNGNHGLSWTIPPQIGNLKQLQVLYAQSSGLHGTLPNEISQLSNLGYLLLGSNNLTGTVPSLANTKLLQLQLTNNRFTGSAPKMNENLVFTESPFISILLEVNSFSGEFDLPLAYLENIDRLEIAKNKFTSLSPKFYNNITKTHAHCGALDNQFKCPIPEWFEQACHATCN